MISINLVVIISINLVVVNKYARFDEIPSMTLKNIMETKHYELTDGQCENSIHKHSLREV